MHKIKLKCRGKKHQRTYDIIVTHERSKRDGKHIYLLGTYIPYLKQIFLNKKNLDLTLNAGAYPTSAVRHLLRWTLNKEPDEHNNTIILS